MEADRSADAVQDPVRDARPRSAAHFFGRLKEKAHGAGGGIARQASSDGQRDRDVPVVAARVHSSRRLRGVIDAARFSEGEGVHVRTHEETLPAGAEVG